MTRISRRGIVHASALSAVAVASSPRSAASRVAADVVSEPGSASSPQRFWITTSDNGGPIISLRVTHNGIVYLSGITADSAHPGDVGEQTRVVLDRIDRLLMAAGTNKSNLLAAQVFLTDMSHFEAHNGVWNEWVDRKNPPVRACLMSPRLWKAGLLVEIMATAIKPTL